MNLEDKFILSKPSRNRISAIRPVMAKKETQTLKKVKIKLSCKYKNNIYGLFINSFKQLKTIATNFSSYLHMYVNVHE